MIERKSYSEAYAVLLTLGDNYISKLPQDVFEFIKNKSAEGLMPIIDKSKGLSEQGLTQEGLAMVAMLRLKYLCESEEEKAEFLAYLKKNEQEIKEILMNTKSTRELLRLFKEN